MSDKRLPMGKSFNCQFGSVELPTEIMEIGMYEDFVEFECVDGIYRAYKQDKLLKLVKCFQKYHDETCFM